MAARAGGGYAEGDVRPTLAITTSTEITAAAIARRRYGSFSRSTRRQFPRARRNG